MALDNNQLKDVIQELKKIDTVLKNDERKALLEKIGALNSYVKEIYDTEIQYNNVKKGAKIDYDGSKNIVEKLDELISSQATMTKDELDNSKAFLEELKKELSDSDRKDKDELLKLVSIVERNNTVSTERNHNNENKSAIYNKLIKGGGAKIGAAVGGIGGLLMGSIASESPLLAMALGGTGALIGGGIGKIKDVYSKRKGNKLKAIDSKKDKELLGLVQANKVISSISNNSNNGVEIKNQKPDVINKNKTNENVGINSEPLVKNIKDVKSSIDNQTNVLQKSNSNIIPEVKVTEERNVKRIRSSVSYQANKVIDNINKVGVHNNSQNTINNNKIFNDILTTNESVKTILESGLKLQEKQILMKEEAQIDAKRNKNDGIAINEDKGKKSGLKAKAKGSLLGTALAAIGGIGLILKTKLPLLNGAILKPISSLLSFFSNISKTLMPIISKASSTVISGTKMLASGASSIISSAGSGLASLAPALIKIAKVATPIAAVGAGAYSLYTGWEDAAKNFGVKEGEEATIGQKVSSALGKLASDFSFGLFDEKEAAVAIHDAGSAIISKAQSFFTSIGSWITDKIKSLFPFFGGKEESKTGASVKKVKGKNTKEFSLFHPSTWFGDSESSNTDTSIEHKLVSNKTKSMPTLSKMSNNKTNLSDVQFHARTVSSIRNKTIKTKQNNENQKQVPVNNINAPTVNNYYINGTKQKRQTGGI